jgi:hypothetical protein
VGSAVPHGDHNPHHGGIVMMKGDDLHSELTLDPAGREYRVYFTDAIREELPASVAADVVSPQTAVSASERIAMQIDDAGESWVGRGRPVDDPSSTTVRVAFAIRHEPYWIDLPFSSHGETIFWQSRLCGLLARAISCGRPGPPAPVRSARPAPTPAWTRSRLARRRSGTASQFQVFHQFQFSDRQPASGITFAPDRRRRRQALQGRSLRSRHCARWRTSMAMAS